MRIAVLTLLILLAGCGGSAGSSGPVDPSITPAPVPETAATPLSTPDYVPAPGIGQTGIVDAGRLVSSHAAVLGRESFTAYINSTRRLPNGSIRSRYIRRIQFAEDKARFYYVLEQMDRTDTGIRRRTIERWSGGNRVVQSTIANGVRTTRITRDQEPGRSFPENASNRVDLYRIFTVMDTSLEEVFERDGRTEYHVIGGPQPVPPLDNVTIRAVVDGRGVIREYRVAYAVGPDPIRVIVHARYDRIGSTEVTTPDWVWEMD